MSCLTLHGLVETTVFQHADSIAVVYDKLAEKVSLTYAQLWEISSKVKKSLSVVVCRNEVIGICPQVDHRLPAVLIGVLRVSASFYSFNVGGGFEYVLKVMREVGSKVIFIHRYHYQDIESELISCGCEVVSMDTPELKDYSIVRMNNIESKQHSSNIAYCITTSGTTGTPKVVMVPHHCIVPNIICLRDMFSLTCNDLVLGATALTFDPSIVEIFMTLSTGACLVILPPTVKMIPDLLLQCISERNHVTVMQITPTLLSRFNAEKLSQTILGDNSVLRVIALGGEPFPASSSVAKLRSPQNETCFYNLYGTTEVSCWATCYKVTEEDIRSDKVIPLGDSLLDTILELRDEFGQRSLRNEGYLYIGGTNRQCIIGAEIKNKKHDEAGVVMRNTGDLVREDKDGQIYFLGRKDSQVKRNGQRVNLEEIKMVCLQHEHIDVCEVLVINDKLVVFGCSPVEQEIVTAPDVREYLKNHVPSHWLPDDVVILRNLPVTSHGKVDTKALQKIYTDRQGSNAAKLSLLEYFEQRWLEVLRLSTPIQSKTSFILSGGNSLLALHLANDVETFSQLHLPDLVDKLLNLTYSDIKEYLMNTMTKYDNGDRKLDCANSDIGDRKLDCANSDIGDRKLDFVVNSDDGVMKVEIFEDIHRLKENSNSVGIVDQGEDQDHFMLPSNCKRKRETSNAGLQKKCKHLSVVTCSLSRCNKLALIHGNNPDVQQRSHRPDICMGRRTDESVEICVEEKWKYNTDKCVDASPLLVLAENSECRIFVGSHSHKFSAINMSTGSTVWETILPDRIESSACLSACGKYVIVGCYDGCVYIMNIHDGTIWWHYDTGGAVKASPTIDCVTGYVYIGSHSQSILCLNVMECQLVWKKHLGCGSIFSSPVVCPETRHVYVATLGGKMLAVHMSTGKMVWVYDFHKPVFSSASVTVMGVCVGCTDGCLYLLSKAGDLIWKIKTGDAIFSSPSAFTCNFISNDSSSVNTLMQNSLDGIHESITIGSHDKYLYCVSGSGEILWNLKTNSALYASPYQTVIATQCTKCIKSLGTSEDRHKNSRLNTVTGESLLKIQKDSLQLGGMDIVDMKSVDRQSVVYNCCNVDRGSCGMLIHVVVVCSTSGTVYIVDTHSGKLLCEKDLNGEIFSSPVVYDNCILIGCRNDYVYCLHIYVK